MGILTSRTAPHTGQGSSLVATALLWVTLFAAVASATSADESSGLLLAWAAVALSGLFVTWRLRQLPAYVAPVYLVAVGVIAGWVRRPEEISALIVVVAVIGVCAYLVARFTGGARRRARGT